ncbi:MAG: hypothetical protein WD670_02220 [Actinomycetota bacterium]
MGPDSIHHSVSGEGGEGVYRFMCPVCLEDVEKQADRKIVALLVSAGVALAARTGGGGAELTAVAELEPMDPLTLDDAIEFHFELQDELAIERFLSEPA